MTDITPADLEYAALMDGGLYTIKSLTAPKPPLPTEAGSVIANVVPLFAGRDPQPSDTCTVMVLSKFGQWFGLDTKGYARSYPPNNITDWTPARIVTDEAVEAAEPELPTGLTEAQRDGRRRPHPQLITCATCQAGAGHPCRRPDGTRSIGHHQIRAEGVRAWWAGWNAAKAEQ